MTQEEKRVAIARRLGAKWYRINGVVSGSHSMLTFGGSSNWIEVDAPCTGDTILINESVPDYFGCLNAMHDAWKTLSEDDKFSFVSNLQKVILRADGSCWLVCADANQRAEAFGLTLNLWT